MVSFRLLYDLRARQGLFQTVRLLCHAGFRPVNHPGIATLMAGQCFGSAIAPFIVVPLAENFGWRSVFFVIGLIGLVWVAVCFYWFRNNPSEAKEISPEEKTFIETN